MSTELLKMIHEDVKEIKAQTLELTKQGAVHNSILKEHEKRSTQLETRILPLENDYSFRHKLTSMLLGGGGLVALIGLCFTIIRVGLHLI